MPDHYHYYTCEQVYRLVQHSYYSSRGKTNKNYYLNPDRLKGIINLFSWMRRVMFESDTDVIF